MQPDPPDTDAAHPTGATGPSHPAQGHPGTYLTSQGSPESGEDAAAGVEQSEPTRTSAKVIAIHALTIRGLREAIPGLIAAFAYLGISGGLRSFGIVGIVLVLAAAVVGLAALNWYRFSYQVANRQLIIAQGIFSRRVRTIPIDRIRAIDSRVGPLHRVLGLTKLKIEAAAAGTGNEEAEIDGLPTEVAHALRGALLEARRRPIRLAPNAVAGRPAESAAGVPGGPGSAVGAPAGPEPGGFDVNRQDGGDAHDPAGFDDEPIQEIEYARSRASWLLYAPLVGSYLALPLAAIGFLSQFVDDLPESWFSWIDLDPTTLSAGQVILAAAGLVGLLIIGSLIGAIVLNWGFRLVGRGDLMVSERGLLTRRTVSVEIARVRGYTLSEGLGMRLVRAARLTALVTGVSNADSRSQLLPLGPRSAAAEVARRAVRRFDTPLRRHPRAALRRRLVRAVLPGALVLVAGLVLNVLPVIVGGAVLTGLGIPLGIDRYRSLGHASDGAAFAVRSGSLIRQTTVMERRAVVGWKIEQSFFQKRSGLSTVTALVGAGSGAYSAVDAASPDALDLAATSGGRWARELLPTDRR